MNQTPAPRTVLSVPGSSARFLEKATTSGAGALMVDLEDGVSVSDKPDARTTVDRYVRSQSHRADVWVRINSTDTDEFALDAAYARTWTDLSVPIVLPMATLQSVRTAAEVMPGVPLIPMIESAQGVEDAAVVAAHEAVAGLMFGELDFIAAIAGVGGIRLTKTEWAHSRLINAAAAAGHWTISGPFTDIVDIEGLRAQAEHDAALGFAGKLTIHPTQIPIAARAFGPSAEQTRWARALLAEIAAHPDHSGAFRFEGRMVDAPVISFAHRVAELAEEHA